jgi:hypothetical protein
MINPKKRFQEQAKEHKWHWQDTVDSTMFQSAAEATMAHMVAVDYPKAPDMQQAAISHARMEGARMFLFALMNLMSNEPAKTAPSPNRNLRHD